MFFSDVVGFTNATATWQPGHHRGAEPLFLEMAQIVTEYGGTLDKFIGDGMVVFFGDPGSLGARARMRCSAYTSLAMQRRMDELQHLWRDVGCARTSASASASNTGYCDVGNFGSERRMDYTIIGPEVNLAARLEQAAGPGTILLSGKTWALVRDHQEPSPAPHPGQGALPSRLRCTRCAEQPAALETA